MFSARFFMPEFSASPYFQPALLGIVAAMRTWSSITFVSFRLSRDNENAVSGTIFSPLASPLATTTAGAIAASELIADKLPILPNRIRPDIWVGRTIIGAVVGAAWARASRNHTVAGAIAGGAAAAVATYALYHLRRAATTQLHIPDPLVGLTEDIALLGIGAALLTSDESYR
jgi:uncharacterized membrane protein